MRWFTIYRTSSVHNDRMGVVRIHDIGDASDVRMEVHVYALKFDDPDVLAIVQEGYEREVAELMSKSIGLPLEL